MKKVLLIVIMLVLMFSCSKDKGHSNYITEFKGEGKCWIAEFNIIKSDVDDLEASDAKIIVSYVYKDDIRDLYSTKRIVFSYGTRFSSQAITCNFDKQVENNKFCVEFDYIKDLEKLTKEDSIQMIVEWNENQDSFELQPNK